MNGVMTNGTLLISDLRLVMKARRLWRQFLSNACMAFEAQLSNRSTFQHLWIA